MKILINTHQLDLLTSNFVIAEGNGLHIIDANLLTESMKEYKVRILFNGWISEIRIGASSSGSALAIAKLMFPKYVVTGSTKQM
jgi:hypothetical protein